MTPAELAAKGLRVTPLVWMGQEGKSYRQADSGVGQYQISWLAEFECWQLSRPHQTGHDWRSGFSRHSSRNEAIAAADAHHAATVAAMIERIE